MTIVLEDLFTALRRAPIAPVLAMDDRGAAIEERRSVRGHDCRFCPEPADAAVYAGPSALISPPRWLDMCWQHYTELRVMLDGLGDGDTDATILARYGAWAASDSEEPPRPGPRGSTGRGGG